MIIGSNSTRTYSHKAIGTLNSDMTTSDSVVNVSVSYADHPNDPTGTTISAENVCSKSGSAGANVVVFLNHDLSKNTIIEVEC